jgi:alkyldihydroxyacetonephosphate synthase
VDKNLVRHAWTQDEAHLPEHAIRWLRDRTGLTERSTPVAPDSAMAVPPAELPSEAREALEAVVGQAYVLTEREDRLGRSGGMSYLDLLHRRGPGELSVPDAVVVPADPDEVQKVVTTCAAHGVGVVPFGGGTSVVGGVRALRGGKTAVIALDLMRLNKLVSVDAVSRIAVLQAGVVGPDAEDLLRPHGLTLGHVPQSFERATIGGFAATRSSGQASAGYGRFEDMVEGVRLATPRGEWRLGVAPASAAGPDLRQLVVGSEGTFGVITEVTVRVRPLPTHRRYEGFVLDGWDSGADAVRALAQRRVLADVTRLSDPTETDVALSLGGGWKSAALRRYLRLRGVAEPCLLILGWEGFSDAELKGRRAASLRALRGLTTVGLGKPAGETWRHGRFSGPRQRDVLMDLGVCVETLETATYWSKLGTLRDAVRKALADKLPRAVVACHISHAYETGASLYFTVLAPRAEDDPVGQWRRAKAAACEAITGLGTISHHHAVGVDHAPYLGEEIGSVGLNVLRAVKRELDPAGVLNPGKLSDFVRNGAEKADDAS